MDNVIIIGGGLAGLTAAIHLRKAGIPVTVIEKNNYPKHKVCGEYISNEVLPYLKWLGADPFDLPIVEISQLLFSDVSGKSIGTDLPLGGFGISRYVLDQFLYQKASSSGCQFIHQNVIDVKFEADKFHVTLSEGQVLSSSIVLGAFGKRSNIDLKLSRRFTAKTSPWLAVKSHYEGSVPHDTVGLHNFRGGYCGVSNVENNIVNVCYLADFESFKKYKNIDDYQLNVLAENPHLQKVLNFKPLFDSPLTISQISFDRKLAVENHILMIGDTAGLIHPLCGNGMAMAIHSAKIASELTIQFRNKHIDRSRYESMYTKIYAEQFSNRLQMGRMLGKILQNEWLSRVLLKVMISFPQLLAPIIKTTHGKPIHIDS